MRMISQTNLLWLGLLLNEYSIIKKKREICQGCELTESLALLLPNQDSWQSHRVKYLGAISCCIMQEGSSLFLQSMNQKFKKKRAWVVYVNVW